MKHHHRKRIACVCAASLIAACMVPAAPAVLAQELQDTAQEAPETPEVPDTPEIGDGMDEVIEIPDGLTKTEDGLYFYQDGKPIVNTWKTVAKKKYYFGKDGKAVTGSTLIGSTYYVFDLDGALCTGTKTRIVQIGTTKYWVTKDGKAKSGAAKTSDCYYIFRKDGKLCTGSKTRVITIAGVKYQVTKDGKAKSGWSADRQSYFAETGKLLKNQWKTIGSAKYYFGKDGKKYTGDRVITDEFGYADFYAFSNSGKYLKARTDKVNRLAQYEKSPAALLKYLGEPLRVKKATTGCYGKGERYYIYRSFTVDVGLTYDSGAEVFLGFMQSSI